MPITLTRNAATYDKVLDNVGEEALLSLQSLGWDPFMAGVHVVQADHEFTVEVLGPLGTFSPYPQQRNSGLQGGDANHPLVVRGRWEQIKVKRTSPASTTVAAGSDGADLPQATLHVADTTGFANAGTIRVTLAGGEKVNLTYTGKTGTSFTGVTGGSGTLATGDAVLQTGKVAARADLVYAYGN